MSGPAKKYSSYQVKSLKPCVSAPSCSVHKHRPRPAPCPRPDECYKACIRKKQKCPSAMEVCTRPGTKCSCISVQSRSSRHARRRQTKIHRTRIRKAYNRRSMISRWSRKEHGRRCCRCSKCCDGCVIL